MGVYPLFDTGCKVDGCDNGLFSKEMCSKHYNRKRRGPNKMRVQRDQSSEEFGDNEFPGLGRVRCGICDEPVLSHAIAPCPELGLDVIHSAPPPRKR